MSDKKNNTGNWNTGYWNTGNCNTGNCNTGDSNTGNSNTGYWNTGNCNTGYCNTGNCNTGDSNTGNSNTGNCNTGNCNTGNCNTGDSNTGNSNTGNRNTGNSNTGNRNTGNRNTGYWNTGNWNTGYCNTGDGKVEFFGRSTDVKRSDLVFPDFFYHKTAAVWVLLSSMSDAEKDELKTCETVDGYLKKVDPKTGWRTAWDKAPDYDRRKCLELPNWDNAMFKEISGIDVEAELFKPEEITMEDLCRELGRNVVIKKGDK